MKDELDILKEVGSIAAGHASTALSEILGKKINLTIPTTALISFSEVSKKRDVNKVGIAVFSKFITGLKGKVMFLLDEKNAFKLSDLSYNMAGNEKRAAVITELGMSCIKEIGNIVTSAYVSALSVMFKRVVLISTPTFISGTVDEILSIITSPYKEEESPYFLFIEVFFDEPKDSISGSFSLILPPESVNAIQDDCKKILEEINK